MDEAPQGLQIPEGRVAKPRQSVSILLTRDGQNGIEILLAHRIPTLRAFADFWSLPGGGIKDFDHDTGDKLSSLKNVEKEWKGAMAAILRETAEEVGLAIGESSVEKVSVLHQGKFNQLPFFIILVRMNPIIRNITNPNTNNKIRDIYT